MIHKVRHNIAWSAIKMKIFFQKTVESETPFSEMGCVRKILFILLDVPFDFLRRICIPPCSSETWDRRFCCVSLPLCVVFFYLTQVWDWDADHYHVPVHFYIILGVFTIWAFLVYFNTKVTVAPKGFIVFAVLGFISSIFWIAFMSNFLIDILTMYGILFDLKPSFLGFTMLAWGNSVGDLVANQAVARKGYARMAITGCFAGPLFNLLVGFGLSIFTAEIKGSGIREFNIYTKDA